MAWSISISNEGWQEIYEACHNESKNWLFTAVNEARKQTKQKPIARKNYCAIAQESLADEAYRLIRQTNTCDNGGYKYWIDKAGFYKIEISG